MRRGLLLALGPVLFAGVAGAGCGDDDDGGGVTLGDDAVVEYHFGDSSVPPEFHRSYTLTISKDEVHVVVDSYGDVLQDTTVPLPAEVWSSLRDDAAVADVTDLVDDSDDDCAGGTSRSLSIDDGGETAVAVDFSVGCSSNDEAADRVDGYVQPVIDAIPDWDTLVA